MSKSGPTPLEGRAAAAVQEAEQEQQLVEAADNKGLMVQLREKGVLGGGQEIECIMAAQCGVQVVTTDCEQNWYAHEDLKKLKDQLGAGGWIPRRSRPTWA